MKIFVYMPHFLRPSFTQRLRVCAVTALNGSFSEINNDFIFSRIFLVFDFNFDARVFIFDVINIDQ